MDHHARVLKAWETRSRIAHNRIDLTGRRFKRLIVLRYMGTKNRRALWLCECVCKTLVVVPGKSLRKGYTGSCGCLNRELSGRRTTARNMLDNPAKYRWAKE